MILHSPFHICCLVFACSHRSIQALGGLIHLFVVYVIVDVFVTLDVVGGMVLVGWWWASGG